MTGFLVDRLTPDTTILTAAAKHAAFVRARGRHYSNEAEAMKVRRRLISYRCSLSDMDNQRAKQLIDDEDDDDSSANHHDDSESHMSVDSETDVKVNGVTRANN